MSDEPIYPGATIGILGSGQLGRMLALEARRMGYGIRVFSPDRDTPADQIADAEVVAAYEDLDAVRAFAASVDVVTYEFENVPSETVAAIQAAGVAVRPGPEVLHVSQNRLREKAFFQSLGIATPAFARVATAEDVPGAIAATGLPAVLKTAGSGYDGKGQRTVRTPEAVANAFVELGGVECILEGFVDFAWEGSVVAARGVSDEFVHYGLVRNEHANHILDVTIAPAPEVSGELASEAITATQTILDALGVVGVLAVEYFVTTDGKLIANEMAPRPHNSGHWTQAGALTSQFEQQLRAVCGLPLGAATMRYPAVAMANLLGDIWSGGMPDWSGMLRDFPAVQLHLYGKREARPGRKMGHLIAGGPSSEEAVRSVREARERLRR